MSDKLRLMPHNWLLFEKRWIMVMFVVALAVTSKQANWEGFAAIWAATLLGEFVLRCLPDDDDFIDPTEL